MSIASVLIPSDKPSGAAGNAAAAPRYSLLLSTDPGMIEAAQRLRYDVFTGTPGFALPAADGQRRDVDRFDEFCDHLLVRDDDTGELVGCYRMLAPAGAIAAGGLYTATEFDIGAFDPLRPSLVEMGRAVVRDGHRNGGVVLLMWAGILAYLDRYGYDHVTGCVSVPIGGEPDDQVPGSQLRGVRDFILSRHAAPPRYRVLPHRPVVVDGTPLDDIPPPARPSVPALLRGYLRLGAQVCGEPAHDPDFGVGDFCVLLDKQHADTRYLKRLRSVSAASDMAGATTHTTAGARR
ncbi:GNAT family N-acyltransferase [Mycobacterium sp.]|uniref:GNAT family N-acetyltransferase n=1 Tax=Mycobacterium sp. TaxID=1785 RepID=UPI0011F4A621|nr:GNAT family N-acyltransferase [Mycobacterium sp.]TAM64634.1 MAG: GNAT family N-acetyltransferase [Mycobacterium sp.]